MGGPDRCTRQEDRVLLNQSDGCRLDGIARRLDFIKMLRNIEDD